MSLKGSQRRRLRALAHSLQPVVQIGQRGLTDEVLREIDHSLGIHELIKIRFLEFKHEKKSLCTEIENHLSAEQIGIIGHIALFYRRNPDPEKRKIRFD